MFFFVKMSRIISIALEIEEEKVFGRLNLIVTGDFHQFPPVVARQSAPLYWPVDSRCDSKEEIIGQKIFEQFTTVVQLKKQMCLQDHNGTICYSTFDMGIVSNIILMN